MSENMLWLTCDKHRVIGDKEGNEELWKYNHKERNNKHLENKKILLFKQAQYTAFYFLQLLYMYIQADLCVFINVN